MLFAPSYFIIWGNIKNRNYILRCFFSYGYNLKLFIYANKLNLQLSPMSAEPWRNTYCAGGSFFMTVANQPPLACNIRLLGEGWIQWHTWRGNGGKCPRCQAWVGQRCNPFPVTGFLCDWEPYQSEGHPLLPLFKGI